MKFLKKNMDGQVLLITLLVLTIASTVVLSLIGRSTTDVSMTTALEESARAFQGAEAGIEDALYTGNSGPRTLSSGVSYSVTTNTIGGEPSVYQFPKKTPDGSVETLWLVNHNPDGTLNEVPTYTGSSLTICWSSDSVTPAIVGNIYYKQSPTGLYQVARVAYDPDVSRTASNNFTSVGAPTDGCGQPGYYEATIIFGDLGITPAVDTLLAVRIRPEYNDASIAVDPGSATLPTQGSVIESTGVTQSGTSRKVIVYQQYRTPASVFDSVVYSQSIFGH